MVSIKNLLLTGALASSLAAGGYSTETMRFTLDGTGNVSKQDKTIFINALKSNVNSKDLRSAIYKAVDTNSNNNLSGNEIEAFQCKYGFGPRGDVKTLVDFEIGVDYKIISATPVKGHYSLPRNCGIPSSIRRPKQTTNLIDKIVEKPVNNNYINLLTAEESDGACYTVPQENRTIRYSNITDLKNKLEEVPRATSIDDYFIKPAENTACLVNWGGNDNISIKGPDRNDLTAPIKIENYGEYDLEKLLKNIFNPGNVGVKFKTTDGNYTVVNLADDSVLGKVNLTGDKYTLLTNNMKLPGENVKSNNFEFMFTKDNETRTTYNKEIPMGGLR